MFLLLVNTTIGAAEERQGNRFFDVTHAGLSSATLVAPNDRAPIWEDAIRMIASSTLRWGGAGPRIALLAKNAPLPAGDLIILGTPQTSDVIARLSEQKETQIFRVPLLNPHGFGIEARVEGGARHLIIAGKTSRGAYNGAVYCRDFLLDASAKAAGKADVFVRSASFFRSPRLVVRGTYHLSMYGVATKYTVEDWMKVIDRYAEDGMERVHFWLSGHHPSKKYPHLYNVDTARGTRLTVEGVRRLIRYCHDRDIKFYIGGGVFAWTATHYLIQGHPEIAAVKASSLCPSKQFARTGTREHFLEMYDSWPEADGFMFEVRDEHGECQCDDCRKPLDAFGSRAYGKAEITWLQEFAHEAWRRNPRLHFCWLIGYAEHARDVFYYDQIRRMNDPRFEWLDTRVGLDLKAPWQLPGPGGSPHPFSFFSAKVAHWDPFYRLPVDALLTAARRCADEGLDGYIPAFEPGFSSASYYNDQIPLPMNILPYCLTGFVYREATWEPGLTLDELKMRIQRRYFSAEAPKQMSEDMIYLQQFSFDHWQEITLFGKPHFGLLGDKVERLTVAGEQKRVQSIKDAKMRQVEAAQLQTTIAKLASVVDHLKRMDAIEARVKQAMPASTPKSRDGFELLLRMIDDTRRLYRQAVHDPKTLAAPIQ